MFFDSYTYCVLVEKVSLFNRSSYLCYMIIEIFNENLIFNLKIFIILIIIIIIIIVFSFLINLSESTSG